jgi:DNA repair photolyase
MNPRATMNGKPVYEIPAKTVINFESGFAPKMLCDGPTFTTGDACPYSCTFCYVPSVMNQRLVMLKRAGHLPEEAVHEASVIRRKDALAILERQLLGGKGRPKFQGPEQRGRVIYGSPLVDVAANMELVRETAEACELILELTAWDIRLLSKSNLLPKIAELLPDSFNARQRVIYGVSTGTLDDDLARVFEVGTPMPSKRVASLHALQDAGHRTFGMICPSLPQRDYKAWAFLSAEALRIARCEHVWAEVINVRGESMTNTEHALRDGGFEWEARALKRVSGDKASWERYSRRTFLAHLEEFEFMPRKLRFLQYVDKSNIDWWKPYEGRGAVLLGKAGHA